MAFKYPQAIKDSRLANDQGGRYTACLPDAGGVPEQADSILRTSEPNCPREETARSPQRADSLKCRMGLENHSCLQLEWPTEPELKCLEHSPRHLSREKPGIDADISSNANFGLLGKARSGPNVLYEDNIRGGRARRASCRCVDYFLLALDVFGITLMSTWQRVQGIENASLAKSEGLDHALLAHLGPSLTSHLASPGTLVLGAAATVLALTTYHYLHDDERYQDRILLGSVGAGILVGRLALRLGWLDLLLRVLPLCGTAALLLSTYMSKHDEAQISGMKV